MTNFNRVMEKFIIVVFLFIIVVVIAAAITAPNTACMTFWLLFLIVAVLIFLYVLASMKLDRKFNRQYNRLMMQDSNKQQTVVDDKKIQTVALKYGTPHIQRVRERKWSSRKGRPVYYYRNKWRWF